MHILRNNAVFFDEDNKIKGNILDEGFRKREEFANYELGWIIRTYITRYDKNQNKIESIPLDSTHFYTENQGKIIDKLEILYERGINQIIPNNKNIKVFKPIGISFGDYSDKCKNLISDHNSLIKEDDLGYLISNLKARPKDKIPHLADSQKYILLSALSSVRKYTCDQVELIVVNLQIGEFENKKVPQISLGDDIKFVVYEEPILYHGDGKDIFYVKSLN